MEILVNIGIALLGIVFYTVWVVRKKLAIFSFNILWKENKGHFLWATVIIILISTISTLVPDSREALKMLSGIDLEFSKVGYLTMGIMLSGMSKKKGQAKLIGSETPTDDDEENDA